MDKWNEILRNLDLSIFSRHNLPAIKLLQFLEGIFVWLEHIYPLYIKPLSANPDKMVKHTQAICGQQPTSCFSVFGHLGGGGLALKGLNFVSLKWLTSKGEIENVIKECSFLSSFSPFSNPDIL